MLVAREFGWGQITVIYGIDEMIQHLAERTLGDADELSKLLVFETSVPLRDVSRR